MTMPRKWISTRLVTLFFIMLAMCSGLLSSLLLHREVLELVFDASGMTTPDSMPVVRALRLSTNNQSHTEYVPSLDSQPPLNSTVLTSVAKSTRASRLSKLPRWMRTYFRFHAKRRRNLNESNWRSQRYVILSCGGDTPKCGGAADRLKPIPLFLLIAARTKRLFMIRWTRPAKLEEFLVPNELNWSVPSWMEKELDGLGGNRLKVENGQKLMDAYHMPRSMRMVLEGRMQEILGGSQFYSELVSDEKESYETIYHDLFRALFKPSPPIDVLLKAKMKAEKLTPGGYAVAHYRAFYAIEDKKHKRSTKQLSASAVTAVNCASAFRPGGPVYFASDSQTAINTVREYAREENRSIVTLDGPEALHLDKFQAGERPPSDFYSVFVELMLMADGRCVTFGQGGFGRFALLLSHNSTCEGRHFYKGRRENCAWMEPEFTVSS